MGSHSRQQHGGPSPDPHPYQAPGQDRQAEAVRYPPAPAGYPTQPPAGYGNGHQAGSYSHQQPAPARAVRPRVTLSAAASFWYILGCIAFGAMYLAKVPAKKALSEAGMCEMTAAEKFWYVLECIAFGGGYLAKLPVKKALTESSLG
jgi:hypothetical protein